MLFRRDSLSAVFYINYNLAAEWFRGHSDVAAMSVLQRIGEKICKHSPEVRPVNQHLLGIVDLNLEIQAAVLCLGSVDAADLLAGRAEQDARALRSQQAAFVLCELKHIPEKLELLYDGLMNHQQMLALPIIERALPGEHVTHRIQCTI